MKTDPISAAAAYRQTLTAISRATTRQEAIRHAVAALDITFERPDEEQVSVTSGFGMQSRAPFVSIALSTAVVQLVPSQAREVALHLLEAADAAESDGFVVGWMRGSADLSDGQMTALLNDFRAYRERRRTRE